MNSSQDFIIVLGAARSGTKLLRDLLATGGARAVPYDVNYVWRYGNMHRPDDVLSPSDAPPDLAAHVLHQLDRMAVGTGETLIEKTVSNVLRIPYVRSVAPHARFVLLERSGEDVVESAMRCWREPPQAARLRQKLATFPWRTAGGYAAKYAWSYLARLRGDHVTTWGPRYPGIDADVRRLPLLDVCARQWVACQESAQRDLLGTDDIVRIRYEDLVSAPRATAAAAASRLGLDPDAVGRTAAARVRPDRVGHAARSSVDLHSIRRAIEDARNDMGATT